MNLRVIPDPEDESLSSFVFLCNHCDKPIKNIHKGVVRWFDDSGHIVVAHKGRCDVALKEVVGDLPSVDIGVMAICMVANLGIETRQDWLEIWDENISDVETYDAEDCEE